MSKQKLFIVMLLLLALAVTVVACGSPEELQEQVEQAAEQVEEVAEEAVAEAEEAMEEAEEAVAEEPAEEAAEEPAEEAAEEPAEEAAEEPAEEEAMEEEAMEEKDMGYDMDVYGNIDEIDLDGTEIVFWTRYDSGSRQEEMDRICNDFNANNEYGITVECLPIGHYGILYDNMIAGMTTGEVPNMIVAYQNQAAAYEVADGLVSAQPYINHPVYGLSDDDKADFFQSFIDSDRLPQFGNEPFGFPAAGRSMEVLFYNADWLAELGYDAPPQTPEEFAEMACAAAAQPFSQNTSDFTTGYEASTDASAFAALVFALGGDIFDLQTGQFTYDTPEAVAAMEMMQQLYADGCITQIAEQYGDQTDFGNGKTLFTMSSSSGLPFYISAVDDGEAGGFNWSVAPIPYSGSEPVQNIYGASTSIVQTDPATQLASWLFLKYWAQPDNQAAWSESSNYFPARASVADAMGDYMAENEAFGTAFNLLQYGKAEAPVAGYDNVRDEVEEAFTAIIFDGADIASTLADLEATANEIMAESAPDGEYVAPEAAQEPMEEVAMMEYDEEIYGNIDELDLDGAEVVFWTRYDSGSRQEEMDRICNDFNANNEYGITVECLPIGHYGILYDNMIAGMTTGEVPGLIVAYQNQAAAYEVADGLVSAQPYINHPVYGLSADDQADFFQSFIDSDRLPQFGNEPFGFPAAGRSMEVLFYNADWLAELGYDAPPQTPEEFAEMACAAAAQPFSQNTSDFTTGYEASTDASAFAALVFALGGDIFDLESGQFTYDTPEAVAAMEMMQQLYADGCIAQIAEQYGDQTDFGNGKTLFTMSSSSGLPFYISAVDDGEAGGFNWSVAPIPYSGSEPVQNIYGASTSIVQTDPVTQLASWLFLKHWAQPENQAAWSESSNYFPARASVADAMGDYMAENEAFGTAFNLLQYGKAEAPVAGYDNVRDEVEEAFTAIIFDGADIASTLADLEATANEIMEESAP